MDIQYKKNRLIQLQDYCATLDHSKQLEKSYLIGKILQLIDEILQEDMSIYFGRRAAA